MINIYENRPFRTSGKKHLMLADKGMGFKDTDWGL